MQVKLPDFYTKQVLKLLLITSLVAIALPAKAQLSGSGFTIDSTKSASASNFKDWYSFTAALYGKTRSDGGVPYIGGIIGNVTVTVKTSLTPTVSVTLPAISGTTNYTVTIDGAGNYVAFSGPLEVINFTGADKVTIKDLTIRNNGTNAAMNSCIRFSNNSDYNTISSCTLEFTGFTTSAYDGSAYIAFAASATNLGVATSTQTGSYNTIVGNTMRTTNSGNPGPTVGISICGDASKYRTTSQNNTIHNNKIQNFSRIGIYCRYGNGNVFTYNELSRANSSSNNAKDTLFGFSLFNNYGTTRSTLTKGNYIHDLPYSGASASSGTKMIYGIKAYDNKGTSSLPFRIDSNTISKFAVRDFMFSGDLLNDTFLEVDRNFTTSIASNNTAVSNFAFWSFFYCDEIAVTNNTVTLCTINSEYTYGFAMYYCSASSSGWNNLNGNIFSKNKTEGEVYGISTRSGNMRVNNNQILNNSVLSTSGTYYFWGIDVEEFENLESYNNLVANNIGDYGSVGVMLYSGAGTTSNTFKFKQNTVHSDCSSNPNKYENNGVYLVPFDHGKVEVSGNIISMVYGGAGVVIALDCADSTAVDEFNNNTYNVDKMSSQTWYCPEGNASDFSGWESFQFSGPGENFINPKFADISNNDFHSIKWQTQNNTRTESNNPKDLATVSRHAVVSDRGALETFSDLKASKTSLSVAATICSGTTLIPDITVKNLFKDTAYNFYVAYAVNGGTKIRQLVKNKILTGDSLKIVFTTPLVLSKTGAARIALFIDAGDDNAANDSFIFNTTVNPSPGGSVWKISTKPTKTIYRTPPLSDVTIVGEPAIYNISSPRLYSNSDYGTKWNATAWAVTAAGNTALPSSNVTFTAPSGGTDLEVLFKTSDANLEDTVVKVCVKFTDLVNGCDTISCRRVLINPVIKSKFTAPAKVCGSDTAKFVNLSSVKSGSMRFHWNFGTGNTKDTSNLSDPIFKFASNGSYKVKLTSYTMPFGFITKDSFTLTVSTKPTAAYNKTNGCEGQNLKFTNQSSPTGATYLWSFGDGNTSTVMNPIHKYSSEGLYNVKLVVNLNGCMDSVTSKSFQYPTPKIGFNINAPANSCSNATFNFQNTTTLSSGNYASYWDFGDSTKTTGTNAAHKFSKFGNLNVKLLVISDFGCRDSIVKSVKVNGAPAVKFIHTEPCHRRPTKFTNNTDKVPNTVANYQWKFSNGSNTTAENTYHSWPTWGVYTAKYIISLDNGCKDSIQSTITVNIQPTAGFTTNAPVCSDKQVTFSNSTTWPQGAIAYRWYFGDGDSSKLSDPSHLYVVNTNTGFTSRLIASIDGKCNDTLEKNILVNALPKTCDFVGETHYAAAYRGAKFDPKNTTSGAIGGEVGVNYIWLINGDTVKTSDTSATALYSFPSDGLYNISMKATVAATGCACSKVAPFVMDRSSTSTTQLLGIQLFPNPNHGYFKIVTSKIDGKLIHAKIISPTGATVLEIPSNNAVEINVNASKLISGVYFVQISTTNGTVSLPIIITN